VNLWMKRAIGAAALGGGLLALGAGAASAQEVSADASARLGRPTSAEVRVCADGRVLSRLVGSCRGQATSATTEADRDRDGIRARFRVPRLASADVSLGARRSRPRATAVAQASVAPRSGSATADTSADSSPRADADADAEASLSRPRAARLLDLRALVSVAGVGLLGSSPFTLAGDPATGTLLPIGGLTLDDLSGEAPAGIGVLESGPIASGNQVAVDVGDVSPSVPVTVCGNSAGVLGDASASCGANQQPAPAGGAVGSSGSSGTGSTGASVDTGTATSDSLLDDLAAGNQVDAGIGSVSPSVPVTVCGNAVGALGDASANCGADTSSGGIIAPPPGTTPSGSTDTDGITGSPGTTGTSGIPGTSGLLPGAGDPITTSAPLRPVVSASGALPFTGAASDLLALVAGGLLAAGALVVRATRPATAATEGGDDR
jgi:hypothetical protein